MNIKERLNEFLDDTKKKVIALLFFVIAGLVLWLITELTYVFYDFDFYLWIQGVPFIYSTFTFIIDEIATKSNLGIFLLFFTASLFFLPIPTEILFFGLLVQHESFNRIFLFVILGLILGQHVNYFLGRFFGFLIKPYIKKKTRKWIHEELHKYGSISIFIFNSLPLPFPLFNFVTGLVRFPYLKWFVTMSSAITLKFFIVYLIYTFI